MSPTVQVMPEHYSMLWIDCQISKAPTGQVYTSMFRGGLAN